MKIDMINKKFGPYLVLKEAGITKDRSIKYLCKCDCGKTKVINGHSLRKNKLKCFHNHNLNNHKLYHVYAAMKQRCYNENFKQFKDYGGRGIKICDEWLEKDGFLNFFRWCYKNNYKEGLQIDRINNDGNYEPNNCRFVTHSENSGIGRQRKQHNNTTGYIGVSARRGGYRSYITFNKKVIYIGDYKKIEDAIEARKNKEIELFGIQLTNKI